MVHWACEIDKAEKVSFDILLGRWHQLNQELTTQARQCKVNQTIRLRHKRVLYKTLFF